MASTEELDPLIEGLAIAAMLAQQTRPKAGESALHPRLEVRLQRRVEQIRGEGRGGALRSVAAISHSAIDWSALPAAGISLLKGGVEPGTPLPRAGFRATEGLRATLRKVATSEPDAATRHRVVELWMEKRVATPVERAIRRYVSALESLRQRAAERLTRFGFREAAQRTDGGPSPSEVWGSLRAGAENVIPDLGRSHSELGRLWDAGYEAARLAGREWPE